MISIASESRPATRDARRSLSPNVVINSETATESFSLMIAIAPIAVNLRQCVPHVQVATAASEIGGGQQYLGRMTAHVRQTRPRRPGSDRSGQRPRSPGAGPVRWADAASPSFPSPAPTAPLLTIKVCRPPSAIRHSCSESRSIRRRSSCPCSVVITRVPTLTTTLRICSITARRVTEGAGEGVGMGNRGAGFGKGKTLVCGTMGQTCRSHGSASKR